MLGRAVSSMARVTSTVLKSVGTTPFWRHTSDPRIVLYHGIGDGTRPCLRQLKDEIPEALLDLHLDTFRRRYQLVSFDLALRTPRACTLTFDDGLSSIYPWLLTRRVPATVFVNSSTLDGRTLLWQHQLSYLMTRYGIASVIDALGLPTRLVSGFAVIDHCQHLFADIADRLPTLMALFGENEAEVARREQLYLTPPQIRDLARAGIAIGSHTARHFPLAAISIDRMRSEIDAARNILQPFATTNALSFPFGMRCDYGDQARLHALECYDYVLEVGDGHNHPSTRPMRTLARVGLGSQHQTEADLYAAVEIQPMLKRQLRALSQSRVTCLLLTAGPFLDDMLSIACA